MGIKQSILYAIFLTVTCSSCVKFLEEKPDQKLQIPVNLTDMQSLLDYHLRVGTYEPSAIEVVADDYYLTSEAWRGLASEEQRKLYLWSSSNIFPVNNNDWSYLYNNVYVANSILERIDKIVVKNEVERQTQLNIKGQALALRGRCFMKLAFIWSPVFSESNQTSPYGIPLKMETDFNKLVKRSTIGETYRQIESDLRQAVALVPSQQVHAVRANKAAVYGLLARLYLVMGDYPHTYAYADSSLQFHKTLLDYNTLKKTDVFPFKVDNVEISLSTRMLTPSMLAYTVGIIDSNLYNSYSDHDLRKSLYFKEDKSGYPRYYGSYSNSYQLFDGIATDEVMLTKIEAAIREGRVTEGIQDLNKLLLLRWEKGKFIPYDSPNKDEALAIILKERRKSLLMRGLRWTDVKRLNREGANILLVRNIEGKRYELKPNDPGYALPIPEQVIAISGIDQNPR